MWGLETDIHASDISYEMHYCGQDCEGYRGPQSPSLETDACLTSHHALIAMHLTAPLEATLASFSDYGDLRAGTPCTTEQLAASGTRRRGIASPSASPKAPDPTVFEAEVR